MENGQRKRKTPAKYESISRHHYRIQTLWSLTTIKTCDMNHTIMHRIFDERISSPVM